MQRLMGHLYFIPFLFGFLTLAAQQPKLMLPIGHTERVVSAKLNKDGSMVITASPDGTAKLWESNTGKLIKDFRPSGSDGVALVTGADFSSDGKRVVINYEDVNGKIYDIRTGREITYLRFRGFGSRNIADSRCSPDGKRILIEKQDTSIWVCDIETLRPILKLKGRKALNDFEYSRDGKKIFILSQDDELRIWDAVTGKPLTGILQFDQPVAGVNFSHDNKSVFVEGGDGSLLVLDALTGKQRAAFNSNIAENVLYMTPDGVRQIGDKIDRPVSLFTNDLWITLNGFYSKYDGRLEVRYWDSISVRDLRTGKLLYSLGKVIIPSRSDLLSEDGRKLIILRREENPRTLTRSSSVQVLEAATGKQICIINERNEPFRSAVFSSDAKKFITSSGDNPVKIWNAVTGQLLSTLRPRSWVYDARLSADQKKIITATEDHTARIWNVEGGTVAIELKGRTLALVNATYDTSGKKILITTPKRNMAWDIENSLLSFVPGTGWDDSTKTLNWHTNTPSGTAFNPDSSLVLQWFASFVQVINMRTNESFVISRDESDVNWDVQFTPDYKKILVTSANNTIKLYDIEKQKLVFTFLAVDSTEFLITDPGNRYDGTEAARKLLYFTCGNEVIELDQVKDQLWVPNLAQRIHNGETINSKTLDELGICGLTPVVEEGKGTANEYYFKIKPRRGGLGETIMSINGTPTFSYLPPQLKKTGSAYELRIKKDEMAGFFVEGQENSIGVKAFTSDNGSSSRSLTIIEDPGKENRLPPNLYAVMVGVSDYKGNDLDLEYAAVDAIDISKTLSASARKLLGDDHVFIYNLTTDKERYRLPEKKSIKSVFEEIGKKATANDILFIFLSGHGVIGEKSKQFYYLTADASPATDETTLPNVGISTAELTEWIKPKNIRAQKRILILDACYSGQAINSIVKIGNERQGFLAAKADDKAQQIRAIDKLNEKSGLFILSASSSDQRAWESGVYSHGYLTYSLLKAIKQQPDILKEGKYLDVGRWLDAAGEAVIEMAKEDGSKQHPQIVSSTNFHIGIVDEDVTSTINLTETKALFTSGNFLNSDEAILDDDLDLRKLVDKQLEMLSRTEGGKKIVYLSSTQSDDAYSLTGSYTVSGNTVTARIKLKQGKIIKQQFDPMTGTKDRLNELASQIINRALDWIAGNK